MNDSTYHIQAEEKHKNLRLDKFLADSINDLSRNRLKALIESGCVKKSGELATNSKYKVKESDEFSIEIPEAEPSEMKPAAHVKLNIVHEDDDFLVIDKQAGLTVHPGAGNHDDTMANALLAHCGESLSGIGGVSRPGIVHRLDKDTSGLMVAAKHDKAHNHLADQISTRNLKRHYLAICWGVPVPHAGIIRTNIGRSDKNRVKMAVVKSGGKEAITNYKLLKIFGNSVASLVECKLDTGRTHQIRVHMAHLGFPIIGDPQYGKRSARLNKMLTPELTDFLQDFNRQALHSYKLGVEKPSNNDYIEFISEFPEDMQNMVNLLEKLNLS